MRRLFYCKMRQKFTTKWVYYKASIKSILQNIKVYYIIKNIYIIVHNKTLLQTALGFYYKMRQFYYNLRQLLQNALIFLQNMRAIPKHPR